MNKMIAISLNIIKHSDVLEIHREIQRRGLNFSSVIRQLLREFRDNDYRHDYFDNAAPEVDVDQTSPDHHDFVEPDYKDEQGGGNSNPVI